MPQVICEPCKLQTNRAYLFKATAKKADDAFKLYLTTGVLKKLVESKQKTVDEVQVVKKKPLNETLKEKSIATKEPVQAEEQKATEAPVLQYIDDNTIEYINESSQDGSQIQSCELLQDFEEEEDANSEDIPLNHMMKIPQVTTDVFPCTRCERSFPLKQLLELHMKNHDRERCFQCDLCDRRFFTKYDLAKHVQTHTMDKPFTCVICNKMFARESLLHRHEKVHVDVPKYLCQECDKTFLTREDLDAHTEKHKKKRPFTCRICTKKFVFKQGLERHEASHADEKPHKCNYCEASFTSPIKLMRHITSHAGLRPYPCKMCGRTFLLSHHLTRHMRSHYATKSLAVEPVGQHKCDVCSMSFRRKDSLINHSAIHSMVNLKCVICNTGFFNAKDVKEHITTHLAGLPYPCDKCDYSFETQDHLEEHELKHAEMEYEEQIEQEVTQEARNKRLQDTDNDDTMDEDGDDDEMVEYTITTDAEDNTQVVRRHRKATKYAEFLKEELGSDVENEIVLEEAVGEEDEDDEPLEPIKPIIRTEGTKVYARKNTNKKTPDAKRVAESHIASDINLDNLGITQEFVKDLPNEQYVDMKIGDVIYKVKKVTMKKTEFDAVAKQKNVEIKGGLLLKKSIQVPKEITKNKPISIENILDDPKPTPARHLVTRTYVKKTPESRLAEAKQVKNENAMEILE